MNEFKFDIHVVRGNGGPPLGELVGHLITDTFEGAVHLVDYSFGKLGEPVEVDTGVFVLQPLHDVGSRVLVIESSAFYGTEISKEVYDKWWETAGDMAM